MKAYKLPLLDLRKQRTVLAAAKCIFTECAVHLRVNFDGLKADQNEKPLMQIRVGMRRTRVALKIFKDILPKSRAKHLSREFKYFGKRFGPLRDLDELLFGMLGEECPDPELEAACDVLKSLAEQKRSLEYANLLTELSEGRLSTLLEAFEEWIGEDWAAQATPNAQDLMNADIGPFAVSILERGHRKLVKKAVSLNEKSVSELHKIRKYVKGCRYHLRFFSTLFAEERVQEGFSLLVPLQNNLGAINDASIGLALMTSLSAHIQAEHLPDCLSLIAAEREKASLDAKAHVIHVQTGMKAVQNYAIGNTDLLG